MEWDRGGGAGWSPRAGGSATARRTNGATTVTVATPTVRPRSRRCRRPPVAVTPIVAPPPTPGSASGSASKGLALDIARGDRPGTYRLHIALMDGANDYIGTADGDMIRFTRDGKAETIRHTSGADTGLKWLADKKDCLTISRARASAGISDRRDRRRADTAGSTAINASRAARQGFASAQQPSAVEAAECVLVGLAQAVADRQPQAAEQARRRAAPARAANGSSRAASTSDDAPAGRRAATSQARWPNGGKKGLSPSWRWSCHSAEAARHDEPRADRHRHRHRPGIGQQQQRDQAGDDQPGQAVDHRHAAAGSRPAAWRRPGRTPPPPRGRARAGRARSRRARLLAEQAARACRRRRRWWRRSAARARSKAAWRSRRSAGSRGDRCRATAEASGPMT